MRIHTLKATLNATSVVAALFLFGAAAVFGQQQVNLTVAPTTTTLPDGTTVPMWGYFCTALPSTVTSTATCAALNPASVSTTAGVPSTWSPVVITVPAGQDLVINLTNSLSFTPTGAATANTVPTSFVIVGQLGGGLGDATQRTVTTSPDHTFAQGCVTWPIADAAPGQKCDATTATNTVPPPAQGDRVQSFSTQVAAGATTSLCWGVCGGSASRALRPGTYLLESGTHPSIQGPMGLYGMVVVTCAPGAAATTCTTPGTAYPAGATAAAVTYSADVDLLFSEIDPVQNNAVNAAVNTAGFSETTVWSGQPGGCGNPSSATYNQCYPPAVNYTPLYYLINGLGFNKTNAAASQFSVTPATGVTGNVLVRTVNAGLRMHVPSIVGAQTNVTTTATSGTPPVTTTTTTPTGGFSLIAEDGNPLPGVPRVQSEVFMAAGKTYDVMINAPATVGTSLPIYDRELSLSANATARDGGMLAYISINGSGVPSAPAFVAATARADTYNSVVPCTAAPCTPLTVSDPGKGVIANDTNVYGVQLVPSTTTTAGTLALNANGTFTYTPNPGFASGTTDTFSYCANGAISTTGTCSSGISTTITFGACGSTSSCGLGGVTAYARSYTANTASSFAIKSPGLLGIQSDLSGNPADSDSGNYPLSVVTSPAPTVSCTGGTGTLFVDAQGGFTVSVAATTPIAGSCSFSYTAKNSQGTAAPAMPVTVTFPAPSNLRVTVLDGADKTTVINDYRWIIEEDRTFYVNPNCATNTTTPPAGCPSQTSTAGSTPVFGVNFHTSYMPVVAAGCTGSQSCEGGQTFLTPTGHQNAVCDVGNGFCRVDATGSGFTPTFPSSAVLDPAKRYYVSILPGDAGVPFQAGYAGAPDCSPTGVTAGSCGHGMGGAPIAAACTPAAGATTCAGTFAPVTILTQPSPYPPAKLSVFVFEDDFPLNGEQDGGGGTGAVNTNYEPGLGGFEITLFDDAGGTGDATGQLTHDMFNQPLSNALAGTIDPLTGKDACPLTAQPLVGMDTSNGNAPGSVGTIGISGRIFTCPQFEADGQTPSPLAGQAVVPNMMQGRYGVVATPAADRIARGEEWLQTNTLDGQKAHDSFLRIGEPSYFQEFGPAGWHVAIGFANPAIINSRRAGVCNGTDPFFPPQPMSCNNTVTGFVSTSRMSRTPDERLYGSGDNSSFSFTQCYVSFGDPDGEDFAFTKCDADGHFTLSGLPDGNWRLTVFDQWNDMLVDGLSTPVGLSGGGTKNVGEIATGQWQANIYTSTFFDANGNGVRDNNEAGLTLVATNIRFRDGSYSNFNNTDLNGNAGFNEVFPLFSWYVIETDTTRYKTTGTHVVYDAGGPADGTLTTCGGPVSGTGYPACGNSNIAHFMANTAEPAAVALPTALRVPGAYYCADADCTSAPSPLAPGGSGGSTGRVDPPMVHPYGSSYGWQGFSGQNSFLEFGKTPYAPGETGGIHGEVNYASTRPFDDPQLLLHVSWTPDVPNVTVNLYQEGFAADGVTSTLKLVDTTKTSSWDDWAQGFRSDNNPNMNCPGQSRTDMFFFTLYNQPDYLDVYNNQHSGTALHTIPNNSQFKCYDGMHNWNQLQPAVYDGMYSFPSVTGINPPTGKPTGTNCTACIPNPDTTDPFRSGTPMLPPGKYVVEVVVPPGYELVKEEDKNILIGDNYIAPVTQQFGGLASIYIIPDQAAVGAAYNANNAQNQTTDLGSSPRREGDTGSVEQFWPCVGEMRVVPDYMSIFPYAAEVAAFAGATRPLCDRKEITLQEQMSALAKFYIFSSAHVAAHFTGVITDDFTSEFDPFSPQFGEKFSPPDLPVSIKDWAGNEISRVYADHWGTYDGLTYSSWEVNPPNPTGYGPTMMVTCMNDPGPIVDTRAGSPTLNQMITDPSFTQGYSQFCYEIPFMPGQTQYMDTPVVPTSAFAGAGYNNVDCSYPDATPAVKEVDGDGLGPWVSAAGRLLTITALGDQMVPNNAYAGPSVTTAPYNQKMVKRHFGFGARCTAPSATSATCNTLSSVTIGGVPATIGTWIDAQITVTVPTTGSNNSNMVQPCHVQQQTQYGGSTAFCGELVITAGNGKRSVDSVTVTIGGKGPHHVKPSDSIQAAIDAAAPGDMLIIDPAFTPAPTAAPGTSCATATAPTTTCVETAAAHNELVIMWKPVRLQGVGAATSIINANTHPAGEKKLEAWRQQVVCLFGLGLNGSPINTNPTAGNPLDLNQIKNLYDPTSTVTCPGTGWNYFNGYDESDTTSAHKFNPQVDRLPLEATTGWDANLNGNLAELLQEPALMGALEGAAVTVLSKGVVFPSDPYDATLLAGFPDGTTLLTGTIAADASAGNFPVGDDNPNCHTSSTSMTNPYPSNFMCNPSSIDAVGITNSSQGGGGIFVHGWGHNIQIANNRIYGNAGTHSGGINLGQGEFPGPYVQGGATNAPPGSCEDSPVFNTTLPLCQNINVNIHHNYISLNSSTGDELFSATPAGAGGVTICTGSDYYKFNYNWVCGNLSSGDGGGFAHEGFSYNGDIEHNSFVFNQSLNPTIPANGGGLFIMGTPDADLTCNGTLGANFDQDCAPFGAPGGNPGNTPASGVTPSDGVGPGLVINANLIMGNGAETGTGAGIAFNRVNGNDMVTFPTEPALWNSVLVTNNIIVDNVGGWDGAGISLIDSPNVNIINNTIAYNASTASAGILFNTLGAPLASQGGTSCTNSATTTCPQPAGLVAIQHSAVLAANLPPAVTVVCPAGHFQGTTANNGSCKSVSYPRLENNIFWQNSSFYIGVTTASPNPTYQQNLISLFNSNGSAITSQATTGACVSGTQYWDIGVRGDTGPGSHASGVTLTASDSVLTSGASVLGAGNVTGNPNFLSFYCDGSRTPPEAVTAGVLPATAAGWQVPPGISDATVPNPIFNLAPSATVDEGNNWVNLRWGPLSMTNPTVLPAGGNYGGGPLLGNYAITTGSSAIGRAPGGTTNNADAPAYDFFGKRRKPGAVDAGAVQLSGGGGAIAQITLSPSTVDFSMVPDHAPATPDQDVQVINSDNTPVSFNPASFTIGGPNAASFRIAANTCHPANGVSTLAPGETCVVNVVFVPNTTQGLRTATLTVTPVSLPAQTASLVGRDTIATVAVSAITPALTTTPASTVAHTGTITVTNTQVACFAPLIPGNPAGCNVDAGPYTPTAITFTTGTPSLTAYVLGGTCAVGTPINPGTSCTITITYTPPTTGTITGNVHLTVNGYGTASTAPIINTTYPAN